MFRNGPEVDGGGTAYLGPTTIIEMTIPMSQSSSDAILDDSWVLAGPISSIYIFSLLRVRTVGFPHCSLMELEHKGMPRVERFFRIIAVASTFSLLAVVVYTVVVYFSL